MNGGFETRCRCVSSVPTREGLRQAPQGIVQDFHKRAVSKVQVSVGI